MTKQEGSPSRHRSWSPRSVLAAVLADDSGRSGSSARRRLGRRLGEGEGAVNILAWPGYAEDGSTDPTVDWVTPFEEQTGCKATVKIGNTSDEMVQLIQTGQYDVVSASGDATLRLIADGDVAPVNTELRDELRRHLAVPEGRSRGTPSTA